MREVTERDMRDPKYGLGEPSEFEFREDGAIVRKDRWERGLRSIAYMVGALNRREFEIGDVVSRIDDITTWLSLPLDEDVAAPEVPKL